MHPWRMPRFWLPESEASVHGPVCSVRLTEEDYRRIDREWAHFRRFKMPTFREELRGVTMKLDQTIRSQVVGPEAWTSPAQAARVRG